MPNPNTPKLMVLFVSSLGTCLLYYAAVRGTNHTCPPPTGGFGRAPTVALHAALKYNAGSGFFARRIPDAAHFCGWFGNGDGRHRRDGRQFAHVQQGCSADPAEKLPGLPSAGRGGADVAGHLH